MPKETMTPRERWLAVLNREKPDRIPLDFWGTPEAAEKLCAHLGCDWEEAQRRLHIDIPFGVGGRYVGPPIPEGEDVFGVRRQRVDYGTGSYDEVSNAPLAGYQSVDEIEANYTWPTTGGTIPTSPRPCKDTSIKWCAAAGPNRSWHTNACAARPKPSWIC